MNSRKDRRNRERNGSKREKGRIEREKRDNLFSGGWPMGKSIIFVHFRKTLHFVRTM